MEKTFKNYLESKQFSKKSVSSMYTATCCFFNWCDDERIQPEQATYQDLMAYMQKLQKKEVKQVTIQSYINSISHYYKWLITQGTISKNPTTGITIKGIRRKRLYHIFTRQELEQLYHQYNQQQPTLAVGNQRKVIIGLAVFQGLSAHDIHLLTEKDLKLREGIIHVPAGRTSNERELKLEASQIMDFIEYQTKSRSELLKAKETQLTGQHNDKLFIGTIENNEMILSNHITQTGNQLKKQQPHYKNFKQLRACVITHWLKTHNLREVQYMAGHRYVSTTESYQINLIEDLQSQVDKYDPLG